MAGLNHDLDEVRGQILGLRSLLTIDEVFAEVRHEETRRRVMLTDSLPLLGDNSALVACGADSRHDGCSSKKNQQWCDHYQKPYHPKDNCWKLHGKPANWIPYRLRSYDGSC